jgi:hypothetical protein
MVQVHKVIDIQKPQMEPELHGGRSFENFEKQHF